MFWTLSIIISLSENCPVYFSKHNVSETEFSLHLQTKSTQLGPIDRASPYLYRLGPTEYVLPEDGDRIQSPKRSSINRSQLNSSPEDGDKIQSPKRCVLKNEHDNF
jgi:hypothetical protein